MFVEKTNLQRLWAYFVVYSRLSGCWPWSWIYKHWGEKKESRTLMWWKQSTSFQITSKQPAFSEQMRTGILGIWGHANLGSSSSSGFAVDTLLKTQNISGFPSFSSVKREHNLTFLCQKIVFGKFFIKCLPWKILTFPPISVLTDLVTTANVCLHWPPPLSYL